jgi:4-diphosphocytidyl-2-C-methyl-D-erythritol kinase
MRLGAKLGADVPFFIFDEPFAIGKGVGDKLEKLDLRKKFFHILIYPGFKVATKDVYRALPKSLTNGSPGAKIALPKDFNDLERLLHNDLETVVAAKKPVIGIIIRRLAFALGRRAIVSGSGPSVFCLCTTREEAVKARLKLSGSVPAGTRKHWQVFIVETKR